MNNGKVDWRGSIAAIVTPFTESGDLDEGALRANIEMTIGERSHAIMVGGHNGEAHLQTDAERRRTWEIGIDVVAKRIPLIVGTGGIRTEHVIELTVAAERLGVDGVMIEVPYFMTPNPPDVLAHYQAISDAVDVPIMAYNHPKRTGVPLSPRFMKELAAVENVVAMKDSTGDFAHVMECLHELGDSLRFFIGPARLYGLPAVLMGAAGFVDGLSQVMGSRISELYECSMRGDLERAKRRQWEAFEVGELMYKSAGTWPATAKDAMRLQGRPGGWPRKPLLPMRGADLEKLRSSLERAGLLSVAAAV